MKLRRLIAVFALYTLGVAGCGEFKELLDGGSSKGKKSSEEVVADRSKMRSCELLVENTSTDVVGSVNFEDSVVGFSKKRGDRRAIVFVAKKDAPMTSSVVKINMSSGKASGLILDRKKSGCFDSAGKKISGTLWKL